MEPGLALWAAEILRDARLDRVRIDTLPAECQPLDVDEGYEIQDALVTLIGDDVYGWKVGSTSRKAQEIIGTTDPFGARLLAANCFESPAEIPAGRFFMRALEVEFAFRLGRDLAAADGPFSRQQAIEAVEALHPAIEISDSRYHDWSAVGAPGLIADNGNDGGFVLGPGLADWRGLDLPAHPVSLVVNGETVAEGSGADVLGDPVEALVWLANDRARRGDGLRSGQVITTGSCTGVNLAGAGDSASAEFGDLGAVSLAFTGD